MIREDVQIVRALAEEIAEIASHPRQKAKRAQWRRLNGLKPERPMVMIDQVCWNEMNADDELTLRCQDKELRRWEFRLRKILYQWKHFPVDMVVDDFVRVPKAIGGTGFGVGTQESRLITDETNDVLSHAYHNQFHTMEDLEKIKMPTVTHNEAETARRMELAAEIFSGVLDFRAEGADIPISVWDPISMWMGVEQALYALMDEPDMMHAMATKVVAGYMSLFDQLEDKGLLCGSQSLIHCTGAWTDDLPDKNYDPQKTTTQDIWTFGLAQMFSTISPAMFEKYEVEICMPLFKRFGLLYYGCCDPLDLKMKEVRKIPNVRKVSMSPWANKARGAEGIGKDYVFSNKPNPAYLAADSFDEDLIRRDLTETKKICEQYGCPLELILKDISTVKYQPQRLWRWAEIAMEVVEC